MVTQGDLLHGDGNGVTSIPLEIADEIPDVAGEFAQVEQIALDYVQHPGEKTLAGLKENRKEFLAAIKDLSDRVQRPK